MITVKIFGTFRLDSGLKQMQADVKTAKELYPLIMDEVKRIDPNTKLTIKDVKGCILSRGGKQISPSTRLDDGDVEVSRAPELVSDVLADALRLLERRGGRRARWSST